MGKQSTIVPTGQSRLLAASDGDDVQAAGVLRMIAAAPERRRRLTRAGDGRHPGLSPVALSPLAAAPRTARRGHWGWDALIVGLLTLGMAAWTVSGILGLFLILSWVWP
jgi:hypothetical protein